MMKLIFVVPVALALLAGPAFAEEQGHSKQETSFTRSRVRKVTATVTAIDQKTRQLTLKRSDGKTEKLAVDDRVKNFAQMRVGDVVTAEYYEAVAIYVSPAGTGATATETSALTTAKPGEMPGATAEHEVTLVATITAIAKDKRSVTLKETDGITRVLPVENPANLEGVKVGDQVTIVASEALAISVERPKGKASTSGSKQKK